MLVVAINDTLNEEYATFAPTPESTPVHTFALTPNETEAAHL